MNTSTLKLSECAIDLDEARGVIDRLEAERDSVRDQLLRADSEILSLKTKIEINEINAQEERARLREALTCLTGLPNGCQCEISNMELDAWAAARAALNQTTNLNDQ